MTWKCRGINGMAFWKYHDISLHSIHCTLIAFLSVYIFRLNGQWTALQKHRGRLMSTSEK